MFAAPSRATAISIEKTVIEILTNEFFRFFFFYEPRPISNQSRGGKESDVI